MNVVPTKNGWLEQRTCSIKPESGKRHADLGMMSAKREMQLTEPKDPEMEVSCARRQKEATQKPQVHGSEMGFNHKSYIMYTNMFSAF